MIHQNMGHGGIRALFLLYTGLVLCGAKRSITPTWRCPTNNTCEIDVSNLGDIDAEEALAIRLTHWSPTHVFTQHNTIAMDEFVVAPLSASGTVHPNWHGQDEQPNTSNATINIVQEEKHGVKYVFASVVDRENVYQVSTRYDGVSQVTVIPSDGFAPEGEPLGLPGGRIVDDDRQLEENYKNKDLRLGPAHRGLANDNGSVIDIMVVWTKSAECKVGGYSDSNCQVWERTKDAMETKVSLAIRETNDAFANSGVHTKLRLVHAYRHPTYRESTGNVFNDALNHITMRGDGHMDDVHEKRVKYGADVVALMIDDRALCGLGWMGPNKDFMFSVSSWRCATGYFSFGHEIAHNMGCQHDEGTTGACNMPVRSNYAYGYRDPSGGFRSIMAYGCRTGQCDGVTRTSPCTREQYFSNPSSKVNGRKVGHQYADNARRINDVRKVVASYFPVARECQNDSQCRSSSGCMVAKCGDPEWMGINVCNYYDVCNGEVPPQGSITEPPTPSPTKKRTRSPTKSPTPSPTPYPTPNPTKRRTKNPTPSPTKSPTPSPTKSPTPSPTPSPTKKKTSKPTVSPTMSPTLSPAPQVRVCPRGESLLELELLTDDKPRDTHWELYNECTGEIVLRSDVYRSANKLHDEFYCVDSFMQYTFRLEDDEGNGLCCQHGAGSFKLAYNGEKVASGGSFASLRVKTFGSKCPTESPTAEPTAEPTTGPTAEPTAEPTGEETPPGVLCQDDRQWAFASRGGTLYGCDWVGFQKELYCRKQGIDKRYALQACRKACGGCPS